MNQKRFQVRVAKVDSEKRRIYGWASVVTKAGRMVRDRQGDIIPIEALEEAAVDYALSGGTLGLMHRATGVGRLIECCVFSKAKQDALGIDLGFEGLWCGWQIDNEDVWRAYKRGALPSLSIGGVGHSMPYEKWVKEAR